MQAIVLVFFLLIFSIQDIRCRQISVPLTLLAAAAGTVLYLFFPYGTGSLLGGLSIGSVLLLAAVLSKGKIGIGDGFLAVLCGLYLGMQSMLAVLVTASFFAAGTAIVILAGKKEKKNRDFPFAPCLFAAAALLNVLQIAAHNTGT